MSASLRVSQTPIDGCLVVETPLFEDSRGTFVESWNVDAFAAAGLPTHWPQDNISISHENVVRGMHIQRRNPQGKLVRCARGVILDICLDLRPESPTFKKVFIKRLEDGVCLYLPPGTAHGFLALEPDSVVYYKCTTLYDKASDGGVNILDPSLGLGKILNAVPRILMSEKDKGLPSLDEWIAQGNK